MGEQADNRAANPPGRRPDRWVKVGFLLAAAVTAVLVYLYIQTGKTILKSWQTDLDAALRSAKQEDRRSLVLFLASPPGETARRLASTTLKKAHNRKAIADGKFVRVKVALDTALDSDTARRYRIRKLPSMLILDPNGVEINRREGMIGEVPFRQGFLDCSQVAKPPTD